MQWLRSHGLERKKRRGEAAMYLGMSVSRLEWKTDYKKINQRRGIDRIQF